MPFSSPVPQHKARATCGEEGCGDTGYLTSPASSVPHPCILLRIARAKPAGLRPGLSKHSVNVLCAVLLWPLHIFKGIWIRISSSCMPCPVAAHTKLLHFVGDWPRTSGPVQILLPLCIAMSRHHRPPAAKRPLLATAATIRRVPGQLPPFGESGLATQ